MARSETIAEGIRRYMRHHMGDLTSEGVTLANEYRACVDTVNSRLEACVALLRKGLRTEAIHQAEQPPPVLEEAALLEFPQIDEFDEICQDSGQGGLPRVDANLVVEIDDAYTPEQQIETLLRRHKLLALARAPLAARINVLRILSSTDPSNAIWAEDLATFEKERHRQIESEASIAQSQMDYDKIELLRKECEAVWFEPPPPQVMESVHSKWVAIRAVKAMEQIHALDDRIKAAVESGDLAAARRRVRRWRTYAEMLTTPPPPEPQATCKNAEAWIQDRTNELSQAQAFTSALNALERALDDGEKPGEVERRWAAVAEFDRGVPKVLSSRYRGYVTEYQITRKRRFRLVMAGVLGTVLITGGTVGAIGYQLAKTKSFDRWESQIASAVDEERWTEADELLNKLQNQNPGFWDSPEIQDYRARSDEALREDAIRSQRFEEAITRAETASVEHPDRDSLALAESLAKSSEELARLESISSRVQAHERNILNENDDRFYEALELIRERFSELRAIERNSLPLVEQLSDVRALDIDLTRMIQSEGISETARTSGKTLLVSIETMSKSLADQVNRETEIADLENSIKRLHQDPEELVIAMTEFKTKFSSHRLSSDFGKSVRLRDAWLEVTQWHDTSKQLPTLPIKNGASLEAAIESCESYLQRHPQSGFRTDLQTYVSYLRRAQLGLNRRGRPEAQGGDLDRLLKQPAMAELYYIEDKEGRRYYQKRRVGATNWGNGQLLIKYIDSVDSLTSDSVMSELKRPATLFSIPVKSKRAPQSEFASKAATWVTNHPTAWEMTHTELLNLLLEYKGIDPIYKASLASELAWLSLRRDAFESTPLATWHSKLSDLNLDQRWINPQAALSSQRESAEKVLSEAPPIEAMREAYESKSAAINRMLAGRIPATMTWRREDGALVLLNVSSMQDGIYEVAVMEDTGWTLKTLCEVRDRKPVLEPVAAELSAGCIVFLVNGTGK